MKPNISQSISGKSLISRRHTGLNSTALNCTSLFIFFRVALFIGMVVYKVFIICLYNYYFL